MRSSTVSREFVERITAEYSSDPLDDAKTRHERALAALASARDRLQQAEIEVESSWEALVVECEAVTQ